MFRRIHIGLRFSTVSHGGDAGEGGISRVLAGKMSTEDDCSTSLGKDSSVLRELKLQGKAELNLGRRTGKS